MIKITPNQLRCILNTALWTMIKNPDLYTNTIPKTQKLLTWIYSIDWDEPNTEVIMIDELPF